MYHLCMKHFKKVFLFSSTLLCLTGMSLNGKVYATNAGSNYTAVAEGSLAKDIYLGDASNEEIRDYYSSLNSLSKDELTGNNLLKNLKPILKNNQQYFKYDGNSTVWMYYEITDRDWKLSPAETDPKGKYNPTTKMLTGYTYGKSYADAETSPYLHLLYRNVGNPAGYTRAWDSHGGTAENPDGIDREHVWPKSHGFNEALVGARGDPHHLIAGDHIINNKHGDTSYGFVGVHDSTTLINDSSFLKGNYFGESKTKTGKVFEPQDSDKGDIARACFYMVARYNNLANNDSNIDSGNPNLKIEDNVITTTGVSTSSTAYSIGILSDLLEWHKLDPVDEYEKHRNELIYYNYGLNRNPFIDFPDWVDIAFGGSSKSANVLTDEISVPVSGQETDDEVLTSHFDFTSNTYPKNATEVTSVSDSVCAISFDKGGGSNQATYYNNGDALRVYSSNVIKFQAKKKIKSIDLTFGTGDGSNIITINNTDDELVKENGHGIWINDSMVGEKTNVDFKINYLKNNHRRITAIDIEYYPILDHVELISNKNTFVYGEGGGIFKQPLFAKEFYSNGDDPVISNEEATSIYVKTYKLGQTNYEVKYGGETQTFVFNVTNKGSIVEEGYIFDHLTADLFTATSTIYSDFEDVNGTNLRATYTGNSATSYDSIQLRTTNNNSGVVQTVSGGNVSKVLVEFNENTFQGRTLDIYGSNTPFEDATNLYDNANIDLLGSIKYPDSNELLIEGNYSYVGIRSHSGALYLNYIDICYLTNYEMQAQSFASLFLELTNPICSLNNGETPNRNKLLDIWSLVSTEYNCMNDESVLIFENDNSNEIIENARERFSYIVSKYGFDNFSNLSISKLTQNSFIRLISEATEKSNSIIFVSVFTLIGGAIVLSYIIYKKKNY